VHGCIDEEAELLVDLLDALELDPDFEPELPEDDAGDGREVDGDLEPILCWTVGGAFGDATVWDEDEREDWQ